MSIVQDRVSKAITAGDFPPEVAWHDAPKVRELALWCRELQREAGDKPFPLAARVVEERLAINRTTAAKMLKMLCADGVIELASLFDFGHGKANYYRYLLPIAGIQASWPRVVDQRGTDPDADLDELNAVLDDEYQQRVDEEFGDMAA